MVKIRLFKDGDQEHIRQICADTAKGSWATNEKKRKAICVPYVDYYMEVEPENVFVAVEDDDLPIGYIVCSTNPELYQKKFKEEYLKRTKKYSPLLAWFTKICCKVNKKLDLFYGGGFHINVAPKAQGKKIGNLLLTALGHHLIEKGVPYLYLVTENKKTRGYGYYTHFGFKVVKKYFLGSLALAYDLKNLEGQHGRVSVEN